MNSRFAVLRSKAVRIGAVVSTAALSFAVRAQAAADPFDAALTTVKDKVGTYAAALVGVAAVAVVFMVAIKYIKKLPKAS